GSALRLVLARLDVERDHVRVGAGDRAPAARRLPVGLLAQQRLTEPVELGDYLLRRRLDGRAGLFAQLLQLAGHLALNLSGHLIAGQVLQLSLGVADRSPEIL